MTTGSSAAFNLAFLTMFDAGDRVAIAAPGYPAYRNILGALGLEVVEIEIEGAGHIHGRACRGRPQPQTAKGSSFRKPGKSDRGNHSGR